LPFPDNSADILMTSNAIGWKLKDELIEIERVVKQGGIAIHICRILDNKTEIPFHDFLVSQDSEYSYEQIEDKEGLRLKYSKIIQK